MSALELRHRRHARVEDEIRKVVRPARRTTLRLPRSWPWAEALVTAFEWLRALPAERLHRRPRSRPTTIHLRGNRSLGLR